jgi:hypothetical protein
MKFRNRKYKVIAEKRLAIIWQSQGTTIVNEGLGFESRHYHLMPVT